MFLGFEKRTTSISGIFALMYICVCIYCLYNMCMLNQVYPSADHFILFNQTCFLFLDYSCGHTSVCGLIFEKY